MDVMSSNTRSATLAGMSTSGNGRRGGPRIAVELPVTLHKKTFALKETSLRLLATYAEFLSEHHGQRVEEERIIDSLIQRLSGDRAFGIWQRKRSHG